MNYDATPAPSWIADDSSAAEWNFEALVSESVLSSPPIEDLGAVTSHWLDIWAQAPHCSTNPIAVVAITLIVDQGLPLAGNQGADS